MLIFNARDPQYKSPIRAVATDESVHLRLVVSRDMHCSGARLVVTKDGETPVPYGMFWAGMCGTEAEYWELHFTATTPGLYFYHFELDTPWGLHFVRNAGGGKGDFLPDGADFQQTVYDKDFQTPAFLRGGLIYQIFPDRFYNSGVPKTGVPATRVRRNWGEEPFWDEAQMNGLWNNDYFGGDLKGIAEKLPYIAKLGVTAIYLNPIFEAHSNHRYDTGDYEKIDPMLGDAEDLKYLCSQAKKLGMGVILDGVFSHTGRDSKYFNYYGHYPTVGAYNSPDSPYYSWYQFGKNRDDYKSWWGIRLLPEIREEEPSYRDYICGENGILRRWMRCGISGWRLDVADELPDVFLDDLRRAVKARPGRHHYRRSVGGRHHQVCLWAAAALSAGESAGQCDELSLCRGDLALCALRRRSGVFGRHLVYYRALSAPGDGGADEPYRHPRYSAGDYRIGRTGLYRPRAGLAAPQQYPVRGGLCPRGAAAEAGFFPAIYFARRTLSILRR